MIEATSCGGVVIFRGKILLLYKNYKNKYEGWVLPKGTVEAGEDYKQEYYNEHPVIWLLTPEKNYRLDLLAGKIVDVSSDAYTLFEDGDEFSEHVEWLMRRSSFEANVDAESVDRIVTLSTCTSAGDDDERYIVACALVEID